MNNEKRAGGEGGTKLWGPGNEVGGGVAVCEPRGVTLVGARRPGLG